MDRRDLRLTGGMRLLLLAVCVLGAVRATEVSFTAHGMSVIKTSPDLNFARQEIALLAGDELELKCLTKGLPNPRIHWYKDDVEMTAVDEDDGQRTLLVSGVKGMSNYTCVASSVLGDIRAHAQVTVTECEKHFHADLVLATMPGCSFPDLSTTLTFFDNLTAAIGKQFDHSQVQVAVMPISCPDTPQLHERVFTDKLELLDVMEAFVNTKMRLKNTFKSMYTENFSVSSLKRGGSKKRRVAVVVVDNTEGDLDDAVWESSMLKFLHEVELFLVGVGKHVTVEDLERMASHPGNHHAFHVNNYRQLHWMVRKIIHGLCL